MGIWGLRKTFSHDAASNDNIYIYPIYLVYTLSFFNLYFKVIVIIPDGLLDLSSTLAKPILYSIDILKS